MIYGSAISGDEIENRKLSHDDVTIACTVDMLRKYVVNIESKLLIIPIILEPLHC